MSETKLGEHLKNYGLLDKGERPELIARVERLH